MGRVRDKWDHAFERGVFPERQDVLLLGYLPVIALAAWLAPETVWLPMSKGAARVSGPLNRKRAENARIIAALLSDRLRPHGAAAVAEEIGAHHHIRASVDALLSIQVVAAAYLAGRKGTSPPLWRRAKERPLVGPFRGRHDRRQYGVCTCLGRVAHLSGRRHGFFCPAVRPARPQSIWDHIERALSACGSWTGSARPLRVVLRVRDNQVISIMMRSAGRRRLTLPFLAGSLTVASGPCALAQRTGATLLPVFTVRGADGTFVTIIEPPTPIAAGAGAQEVTEQMAVHCVRLSHPTFRVAWTVPRLGDDDQAGRS